MAGGKAALALATLTSFRLIRRVSREPAREREEGGGGARRGGSDAEGGGKIEEGGGRRVMDGAGRTDDIYGEHVDVQGLKVDERHVLAEGMVPGYCRLDPVTCAHKRVGCRA